MLGIHPISQIPLFVNYPTAFEKGAAKLWKLRKHSLVDELTSIGKGLSSRWIKKLNPQKKVTFQLSSNRDEIVTKTSSLPKYETPTRKQRLRDKPWEVSKGGEYAFRGPAPWNQLYPMCYAIYHGNVGEVKRLLDDDWNPNGRFMYGLNYDQRLFLANAAHLGQDDIAGVLIQAGAIITIALENNNSLFRSEISFIERRLAYLERYGHIQNPRLVQFLKNNGTYESKEGLEVLRKEVVSKYTASVKLLLDHAFGMHFSGDQLKFLVGLDISEFNFVGISLQGEPVTREKLIEMGLKLGFTGAEKAIISETDLLQLKDESRKAKLLDRLENKFTEQGKMISKDGIVNLVPLDQAASRGNNDLVKLRLNAGVDPNEMSELTWDAVGYPILAAVKNRHLETVKLLAEHPEIDLKTRYQAFLMAEDLNFLEIVKFLEPLHSVNDLDLFGTTKLHSAAGRLDHDKVKELLAQGADPNRLDKHGVLPGGYYTNAILQQLWFKKRVDEISATESVDPIEAFLLTAFYNYAPVLSESFVDNEKIMSMLRLLKEHGAKFDESIESLLTTSAETVQ